MSRASECQLAQCHSQVGRTWVECLLGGRKFVGPRAEAHLTRQRVQRRVVNGVGVHPRRVDVRRRRRRRLRTLNTVWRLVRNRVHVLGCGGV